MNKLNAIVLGSLLSVSALSAVNAAETTLNSVLFESSRIASSLKLVAVE